MGFSRIADGLPDQLSPGLTLTVALKAMAPHLQLWLPRKSGTGATPWSAPLSSLPEDDVGAWGQLRPPLRCPFKVRTDLAIDPPPSPPEKTPRGCGQFDGSPLSQYVLLQESLAKAEVNSSPGLAGCGQMGPCSVHAPQELYGLP